MEQGQVVRIRGGGRFGSGYLIAPRLVLTAEHVLPPKDADVGITVSLGESGEWSAAVVRWRVFDDAVDAALLEVQDEHWVVPGSLRGHTQRWGRFVTAGTELRVAAMGFPRQQREEQRKNIRRNPEVLDGRVRPHGGATFEILDAHSTLAYDTSGVDEATTTAWSGMSGAAVFAHNDKLLLGVVRNDRRPGQGTRLLCTSSKTLLARDDFRAVVRVASGVDPQLEPSELAGLLEPAPPKLRLTSLTMLLRADAEVVPFHGRDDTLADLEAWCLSESSGPAVHVLTGPGGQGKTRLARQLMRRLRDRGWVVGQVRGDRAEDLRRIRTIQHPTLFVVDYAETRPGLVRELREWAEDATHPVRLLLLARSLGSWQIAVTGALIETRLHALSPGTADKEYAFRQAARGLARRLAEVTGRTDVDWSGLADTVPAARPGEGPRTKTALAVQMAALIALLRDVRDPRRDQPLEAELLDHERKYWLDNAAGRDIGRRAAKLVEPAIAVAVLCPARDEDEALAAVSRALPREEPRVVEEIADLLRDLYPPPEGRYWGQLEPDRLAEYQASEQIIRDGGLLGRLFARAPDHQQVQILTVLARSAVAHANEGRGSAAQTVVERLREALRSAPADRPLTAAMLRAHSDTLPEHSHVLRDYALDVARELCERSRATDDPRTLRDHAWSLHNLAVRHLAVGDLAKARDAAGAAAALRERLADDNAVASREEWADSLLVLSKTLRATGRSTEAYDVGKQALSLFRTLAANGGQDSEKRERGLVRALINQSSVVWQLDQTTIPFDQIAESDEYTEEAVTLARDLAGRHPELDPGLLAYALDERGANLWRLERHPESLRQNEEALETVRRLADENPDAFTADLADALLGLALGYAFNERPPGESMALEREAIALLRPLAVELPEVHLSVLAQQLHNLACSQRDDEDCVAARESIEEAIEHRRVLTRGPSGNAVPQLAQSVWVLGTIHAHEGDHETAVERYTEALEIYTHTTRPLHAREQSSQANVVDSLSYSCEVLGRAADAVAAQNRALAIRRRLSEYAPRLYAKRYATALHNQSDLYRRHDRPVAARIRLREALARYRRLPLISEEDRESLAYCLHDLGVSYAETVVTVDRAVVPLREAYDLRVELSAADARYEEQLAGTCTELARALTMTSHFPEAVRIAEHEVRLRRRLLAADHDSQESSLCFALLRLAEALTMSGDVVAAWRTVLEAERLGRKLADRTDRPPAQLAYLLRRLARALSLCGRNDWRRAARAEVPARRATRIYRDLVDREPANGGYQAGLNSAVSTLVTVLERLGRHADAAEVQLRRGASRRDTTTLV